jgi:hypothetical protein
VHSQQGESVNILSISVLIVLLFQENKSFGARTICIHPLMYVKPCREQSTFMIEVAISNGFGIKRLRILNTFGNLKGHLIIFLIVSALCLNQGLSNVKTFSRF